MEKNRRGWGFVNAGDKALKLIKGISGLQFLDLFEACDEGDVSDEGLAHIRGLTELRYLALGPGISDKGLADWLLLTELRELRLDSARDVTDAGLQHLTKLNKLQSLSLQYTDVAGAGLDHLAGLKKLKELNLDGTPVTKEAVAAIQKALPKCKILWDRPKKATAAKSTRKLKNASAETAPAAECGLTLRATLRGHANKAGDAAFSADGAMLVSIAFNKVLLWDGATGAKLRPMELKQGSLWGAAFTPDGKLFASGSNGSCVFLWDTASGKQKMCLETPNSVFTALDIDAGGNRLAAGGQDSKVYLWELPGGKLLVRLQATAGDFFSAIVFSPDGKTLATCGREPVISLWSIPDGKKERELQGPPHTDEYMMIRDVAFSLTARLSPRLIPIAPFVYGTSRKARNSPPSSVPCPSPPLPITPDGRSLAAASNGDARPV